MCSLANRQQLLLQATYDSIIKIFHYSLWAYMKLTAFLKSLYCVTVITTSISAHAVTETNTFNTGSLSNSVILIGNVFSVPGNHFVDHWNFSINETEQFAGFVADIDNLPAFEIAFNSFGATLLGPTQTWDATKVGNSFRINSIVLTQGNYAFQVFGTIAGSKGAAYSGTLSTFVTAVPEPETYLMLIAGLGLIALQSFRLKSRQLYLSKNFDFKL
jgi:hypothetical protein